MIQLSAGFFATSKSGVLGWARADNARMHGFKRIGDEEIERINRDRRTVERGSTASGDSVVRFSDDGCRQLFIEAVDGVLTTGDREVPVLLTRLGLGYVLDLTRSVRNGRGGRFIATRVINNICWEEGL